MSFVEDFHESPHYNYHHTSFIMFTPFATFKCVTVRILEPPMKQMLQHDIMQFK